jgi:mannosyltransferase
VTGNESIATVRAEDTAPREQVWRRSPTARRMLAAVPLLVIASVAAAARFALIGHQSLWFDEIVSATLAKQPFGVMLHDLARSESTPPVYYILAWLWMRAFGSTAAALRSLSACAGVLTVVVIYATGRLVFSKGAAIVAGALAATAPMLIWYSNENRAYSLLTLLESISIYFFFRARSTASSRSLAGWALSGSLAIATHYFAVFVVFPEAVLLLYLLRGRILRPLVATAAPVATAAALLPLAIDQRNTGHTRFIATTPLSTRAYGTLNELLLGRYGVTTSHLVVLGLILAAAVGISIALRTSPEEQRAVLLLLVLGVAALVLPLAFTPRFFFHRNLIVVLPPFLLIAGAACGPRRGGSVGVLVGCSAAVALLFPTVVVAERPSLQREDWRDMPTHIGRSTRSLAILTYPQFEHVALQYYWPGLRVVNGGTLKVREIVLVGRLRLDVHHLPRGFRRVEDTRFGVLRLVRLQSSQPREIDVGALHLRPTAAAPLLHPNRRSSEAEGQDAALLVARSRP